jgi:hypothetical protein
MKLGLQVEQQKEITVYWTLAKIIPRESALTRQ